MCIDPNYYYYFTECSTTNYELTFQRQAVEVEDTVKETNLAGTHPFVTVSLQRIFRIFVSRELHGKL